MMDHCLDTDMSEFFAALAAARFEYPDIPRNRTATVRMKSGGSYSYTYADLSDVLSAINPVLAAHGLDVSQWPEGDDLVTCISHSSGAYRLTRWPIKRMGMGSLDDATGFQSSVQASKRYALTAALGITTEETVEGNVRTGRDVPKLGDSFDTDDGVRLPVGAKIKPEWDKRQVAEEVARAIIAQFDKVKTTTGVDGVWNRNAMFTEKLRERHPDLFHNVFEEYQKYLDENGQEKSE